MNRFLRPVPGFLLVAFLLSGMALPLTALMPPENMMLFADAVFEAAKGMGGNVIVPVGNPNPPGTPNPPLPPHTGQDLAEAVPALARSAGREASLLDGVWICPREPGAAGLEQYRPTDEGQPMSLEFRQVDIRDVLRIVQKRAGVNLLLEKSVRGNLNVRMVDVPALRALRLIAAAAGCVTRFHGGIIYLAQPRSIDRVMSTTAPSGGNQISLDMRDTDIRDLAKMICSRSGKDFAAAWNVRGNVTVALSAVEEAVAMEGIARCNGFDAIEIDGMWLLGDERSLAKARVALAGSSRTDGTPVSLDFRDTRATDLARIVGTKINQPGISSLHGNTTMKATDRSGTQILRILAVLCPMRTPSDLSEQEVPSLAPNEGSPARTDAPPAQPVQTGFKRPPPPPQPALRLTLQAIAGNETEREALIFFDGKQFSVKRDQVIDGKFKVIDILEDRIIVYSNREQMRRTFPLGGGAR